MTAVRVLLTARALEQALHEVTADELRPEPESG
jgi:hypothetical protein